jgi:hypothetical protein
LISQTFRFCGVAPVSDIVRCCYHGQALRRSAAFILLCGFFCIASLPVNAQRTNFRVTLNGFKVNLQSLEGLRVVDGMGDEVYFINHVGTRRLIAI